MIKPLLLLVCLFVCLACPTQAQDSLLNSRQGSYYTYIYRITSKEAHDFLEDKRYDFQATWAVVDSFPQTEVYQKSLPVGHYLFVHTEQQKLITTLETVAPWQLHILNNETDFQAVVHDTLGRLLSDVVVVLDKKLIPFNTQSQSYKLTKSNRCGVLSITHQGFTSYHEVSRSRNNTRFRRIWRKVVYYPPVRVLTFPFRMVVRGVRNIRQTLRGDEPTGFVEFLVSLFNEDVREERQERREEEKEEEEEKREDGYKKVGKDNYVKMFESYIVLNKPKYFLKDTVKMKAGIWRSKNKMYQEKITVFLEKDSYYSDIKPIKLTELKPYNELGGYEYVFCLHDSLKLKLNEDYRIVLRTISDSIKIEQSMPFEYEEYELKNNTYSFQLFKAGKPVSDLPAYYYDARNLPTFYKKEPLYFIAKGTDINGLNVLDARVKICITTKSQNAKANRNTFVPDTLWQKEVALEPLGETKIILPAEVLPPATFEAEVKAIFLTSHNEKIEKKQVFVYVDTLKPLPLVEFTLKNDSLFIMPMKAKAGEEVTLYIYKHNKVIYYGSEEPNSIKELQKNKFAQKKIVLPHVEHINPLVALYKVVQGKEAVDYKGEEAMLSPYSKRTSDSVWVGVQNPRKIPFWYTLYFKNKVIKRGYGTALDYKAATKSNQHYFFALQYIWQGVTKEENYVIDFKDNQLQIEVEQPLTIYPGQKVKIGIAVTDMHNKPVPNADVTAYSFTKKFQEASAPALPTFFEKKVFRKSYNKFTKLSHKENKRLESILQWEQWKGKMGLDTIAFYQLLYPKKALYKHYIPMRDSVTQFSIYITDNTGFKQIYWIDANDQPVYYEGANKNDAYSFPIQAGKQMIRLRTANEIVQVILPIQQGYKGIFSINLDIAKKDTASARKAGINIKPVPDTWQPNEMSRIMQYLMPYQYNRYLSNKLIYAQQGKQEWIIENISFKPSYNGRYQYIYPVFPRLMDMYVHTSARDSINYAFSFKPYQVYIFPDRITENVVRTEKFDVEDIFPSVQVLLPYTNTPPSFASRFLTIGQARRTWHTYQKTLLPDYANNRFTTTNPTNGTLGLLFQVDSLPTDVFSHWVLVRKDSLDFIRLYQPHTTHIFDLPKGAYTLFLFTDSGLYQSIDIPIVQPNGITFITLPTGKPKPADKISKPIIDRHWKIIFYPAQNVPQPIDKKASIYFKPNQNIYGHTIRGRVTDRNGEALPGVAVLVVGEQTGMITNLEGIYEVHAPLGDVLQFSFIGYRTIERYVNGDMIVNVTLEEYAMVTEVVVTGYRVSEKRKFTGSATVVTTRYIDNGYVSQNRMASFDQVLQGRAAGVQLGSSPSVLIRGQSLINGNTEPLYIIDGIPISASEFAQLNASDIISTNVLKYETATALYGSRASNGVIVVQTKKGVSYLNKPVEPNALLSESSLLPMGGNSLRRNFSDYAYWQPRLRTDKAGKASFEVTFPDDVTNWRTFVLAHTAHKQTGSTEGNIKAYKSLVTDLALPRFMVVGDSVQVLGKVMNYTPDTLQVQTTFSINGTARLPKQHKKLIHSAIDSLYLVGAGKDSIRVQYQMETPKGYQDGELRTIPIYPQGVEESKGQFFVLQHDTTVTLTLSPENRAVRLYAQSNGLDWVLQETGKLRAYKYLCNEQLASKIKGMLAEKQIHEKMNKPLPATHDKDIKRLIRELLNRQKENGEWGWWAEGESVNWITLHAVKVLLQAQKQGFEVQMKGLLPLQKQLAWEIEKDNRSFDDKVMQLELLRSLGSQVNEMQYLAPWTKDTVFASLNLTQKFKLWSKMVADGKPLPIDSLTKYEMKSIYGSVYFGEVKYNLWDNHIQATLLAYQILKKIGGQEGKLEKIRNFFIEQKGNLAYRNTYEIACVLENILPDMLEKKSTLEKNELFIQGAIQQKVTAFPFEHITTEKGTITLRKTGDFPLYVEVSEKFWNEKPQPVEKDFVVKTSFEKEVKTLEAGKAITLTTAIEVKRSAEYVMLEIPIPAGCSYENTRQSRNDYEIYREYFRDKVCIYFQRLPVGKFAYTVNLLPRYAGTFTQNPAKIEMMYFSNFYGRNESKKVAVR